MPLPTSCLAVESPTTEAEAACIAAAFRKRHRAADSTSYTAHRDGTKWIVELDPAPHCSRGGGHLVILDPAGKVVSDQPQR